MAFLVGLLEHTERGREGEEKRHFLGVGGREGRATGPTESVSVGLVGRHAGNRLFVSVIHHPSLSPSLTD